MDQIQRASPVNDVIPNVVSSGFSTGWDYKGSFVDQLKEDGYERFSQYSATPDSTLLFAGPARFNGIQAAGLLPIGMVDGISFSSNAALARLNEIGSNRHFFTRGKVVSSISFGRMLADQRNILSALTAYAAVPPSGVSDSGQSAAAAQSPNPNIAMNLDSELFNVPFGMMLLFKTKGGGSDGSGKILTAVYLENCMFSSYNFSISSGAPVITEGISIEFDRPVPVSFAN